MIWLVVMLIGSCIAMYFIDKIPTGPSLCPNCKKEVVELEEWSYTEYSWGLRCPHCKYEYDITP